LNFKATKDNTKRRHRFTLLDFSGLNHGPCRASRDHIEGMMDDIYRATLKAMNIVLLSLFQYAC
jgi:hypothetical protein